jgi:glycerol-3-phosphate acyltransferase PlsY
MALPALLWIAAYLVASIPFGYVVARARGVDIRQAGSGNIGATNVGRVLGKPWGIAVLGLDVLKGAAPMWATSYWAPRFATADAWGPAGLNWIRFGTGFACMLGSIAPIYLRFRGGKAVATSLGIMLGVPQLAAAWFAALAAWGVVRAIFGYVSLASIIAAVTLPLAAVAVCVSARPPGALAVEYPLVLLCATLSIAVLVRHRSNIARLIAGTEPRSSRGAATAPPS